MIMAVQTGWIRTPQSSHRIYYHGLSRLMLRKDIMKCLYGKQILVLFFFLVDSLHCVVQAFFARGWVVLLLAV